MKPLLRATVTTVAALSLGACTMWKPHPALTPSTQLRNDVLVTRTDNTSTVVRLPTVTADSLTGSTNAGQRIAIPLTDVRAAYTRRPDAIRTAAALGAAVAAALLIRSATDRHVVY